MQKVENISDYKDSIDKLFEYLVKNKDIKIVIDKYLNLINLYIEFD